MGIITGPVRSDICVLKKMEDVVTVSYTHLDVYKRQSFINPYTYERAIQVLESKTLRLEDLITNIVPLDDIADVFTKPEYRRAGKVMIKIAD